MKSTLKVTPAELRKKGQEFGKDATEFKNITNRMFDLISDINGKVWSGDAANAYKNQFKQLDDDAKRLYKLVKEFSDDVIQVADKYKQAETANIQAAKKLATDVIK